jgi:hypothetical protein
MAIHKQQAGIAFEGIGREGKAKARCEHYKGFHMNTLKG